MKLEERELSEHDVTLQFPHNLPWEYLMEKKREDETSFWTQYMNIAEGNFKPTFPIEKLEAAKVSEDAVPMHGTVHIAWRFEYSKSTPAAAVGIESHGRMYVVEILRETLSPSSLAKRVVDLARKWEHHSVSIEDTPGARTMENHIANEALEQEWWVSITWTEFLQDDTARAFTIKATEPHLLNGRLLFSDGIVEIEEKFRALYHYGMIEEYEIPDVVSKVAARLPATVAAEGFEAQDEQAWEDMANRDAYNRVYGLGLYQEQAPYSEPVEEEEEYSPQFDDAGLSECMPGLSG
jgi:hypothetical protein